MSDFCKLYETDHGQILVKLDRNSEGDPEVRFYARPPDLGVCSLACGYKDDDAGWGRAEEYFARVDSIKALKAVEPLFQMAKAGEAQQ
jgi:hypothetical protein